MSQQQQKQSKQQHPYSTTTLNFLLWASDFGSSWFATATSICFSHPIDTARIRRQCDRVCETSNVLKNASSTTATTATTATTTTKIEQKELFSNYMRYTRSLYRGFFTPIVTTGPLIACGFATNDLMQRLVSKFYFDNWNATETKQDKFTFKHFALAGAGAGMSAAILQTPIAVIRIKQQVAGTNMSSPSSAPSSSSVNSTNNNKNSFSNMARFVYQNGGIRKGLYAGFPQEFVNAGLGRLVYFSVYEEAKRYYPKMLLSNNNDHHHHHNSNYNSANNPLWINVLAAVTASWCGWIIIFPFDVIKSRIQQHAGEEHHHKFTGRFRSVEVARQLIREKGIFGLFTGLQLTLARAVMSSGISLPLYDICKPKFRKVVVGDAHF